MITGKRTKVGEIRPSQLMHTWGIGSVVDLAHLSVLVSGTDDWSYNDTDLLEEPRLTAMLKSVVGDQLKELRTAPLPDSLTQSNIADFVGVPAQVFPRWMVCPYCQLLSSIDLGVFQFKVPHNRPGESKYVHERCPKYANKDATVVPVRFVQACTKGHMDDFPWMDFVHKGAVCKRPTLRLNETAATGQAADVLVSCTHCGVSRRMSDAITDDPQVAVFPCSGLNPQLREFDPKPCEEVPRAVSLGASNLWFPQVYSAIDIPAAKDETEHLLEELKDELAEITSREEVPGARKFLRRVLAPLEHLTDDELWEALSAFRDRKEDDSEVNPNLRRPEWDTLINPQSAATSGDFQIREVETPQSFKWLIEKVVLVDRLREVKAFVGFNRIQSPNTFGDISGEVGEVQIAPICDSRPRWVPASEVRGEGIFLQLRESAVAAWVKNVESHERMKQFEKSRFARLAAFNQNIDRSDMADHLARRVLVHSLSHAFMRQLALECGYSASSIRERLYSVDPTDEAGPMAGILISTSAPDSEGTLGGLVRMGELEALERTLTAALSNIEICASDPLCSEHEPDDDGHELYAAACHACLFAPETSCEMGNSWLDRSVLVDTLQRLNIQIQE